MTLAELQASIREAEAALAVAAPEMRDLLARQIATLRSLEPQLRAMEEAGLRAPKLPLAKEMVALFTPRPPAQVPTWIPDDLVRSQVTAAILRCPPGRVNPAGLKARGLGGAAARVQSDAGPSRAR